MKSMSKSVLSNKSLNLKERVKEFAIENKWIIIIMILLFLQRIFAMLTLGVTYNLDSDDLSYVISGITFKNTGAITMHGYLSAQIMPGMPVLIGFISMIFGEGKILWLALKLLWFLMGTGTAFFMYKIVTLYGPKWCGILSVLPLFWADFAWMDNTILTETPFMLLFVAMIYFTIMMARKGASKYFWLCLTCYMGALMFKANIGVYPIFAFVYLLIMKYDFKTLMKQCLILSIAVLCFVIPWSIRNYIHYNTFVPLTWGAGNPLLLGTYQGHGYPTDEELDYETNVYEVANEKYAEYYDESGEIEPYYMRKYIALETDGIMAKYRMREWMKKDPVSMLKSYFIEKPLYMIHSVFYWQQVFDVPVTIIKFFRYINWILCIMIVGISLFIKKYRSIMFLLAFIYIGNIYIYAMTFAFNRYAATLLPLRFMIIGIGCAMISKMICDRKKKNQYNKTI